MKQPDIIGRLSHLPTIKWAETAEKVTADHPSPAYVPDERHNGLLVAISVSNTTWLKRLT